MKQVSVFLVMLAGVTQGFPAVRPAAETHCNATQNTSTCSIHLGDSVYIQVMANASGHQLRCKKQLPSGASNVFTLKKGKVVIEADLKNRTEFFINNGTLKLRKVEETDAGQYTVEVFDENGVLVETKTVKLDVQEVQENLWPILVTALVVVGLLVTVIMVICCICRSVRHHRS